jgi:hypothetical protein
VAERLLTAPRSRVPHHGPVRPDCPVECLLSVLSMRSFNPLSWAQDAPFDPPRTVGDVMDLYTRHQLRMIRGLGPRRTSEIEAAWSWPGSTSPGIRCSPPTVREPPREQDGPGRRDTVRTRSCTARRATGRSTRAGTLVLPQARQLPATTARPRPPRRARRGPRRSPRSGPTGASSNWARWRALCPAPGCTPASSCWNGAWPRSARASNSWCRNWSPTGCGPPARWGGTPFGYGWSPTWAGSWSSSGTPARGLLRRPQTLARTP